MNLLKRIYSDPLVRRFLAASLFAGAFVWVAIDSFHVDSEVVLEFFLLSIALVVLLMGLAFVFALFMQLVRKLVKRGSGPDIEDKH